MMLFIRNILYVSKYESKLLFRSWFFRIFAVLALAVLFIFGVATAEHPDIWTFIPSNIPYANMLIFNTGQAVVAIFLASDFLKRDKKLDTSEIFYVRPLSNAEYVFGKICGNLRVFLVLNLIIIGISIVLTTATPNIPVDWGAYVFYFLTVSIPTLVYIIGLSVFLMLIIRSQAITFVLLLGYIGATLFYLQDKFYFLFDYMLYYFPLMKSTIVGFPNLEEIIVHRSIYLFAGLACIFMTVRLFGRLPNSSKSNYTWVVLSFCSLLLCAGAGYRHVGRILQQNENRLLYTQINNRYVHAPKMVVERYDISVKQNRETFTSETGMTCTALSASRVFTFCLNPGLEIYGIKSGDRTLDFKRDRQILLLDFGKEIPAGDTVSLSVEYGGKLDNSFCYLDIPEKELNRKNSVFLLHIDRQYSFQTDDYMLLTPETYWYPRPGTGYSDESPDWQQTYFSRFTLNVTPLPGLTPLSQGEGTENADGSYSFQPEYPVQAISLAVGKYRQKSCVRDSICYSIWHIEGNDVHYATALDSIHDTIPYLVNDARENFERQYKLDYPFRRFSVVEVPAQFSCYPHAWSQAQESVQPEMVFFVERGCTLPQMNLKRNVENYVKWNRISVYEAQMGVFHSLLHMFISPVSNHSMSHRRGTFNLQSEANRYYVFPQFFNFRYNIFSAEWSVANRMIELYLQNNLSAYTQWERETNGISNSEKANVLLGRYAFKDLLADAEYRNLINSIVELKAFQLFAPAELNIGTGAFRDSLRSILNGYTFRNVRLEYLLDAAGRTGKTDILANMAAWNAPVKLPVYSIGKPEIVNVNERGKDFFTVKVIIGNDSDFDGIVHINFQIDGLWNDEQRATRKVMIPARRSVQIISVWENVPFSMSVNTMISGNLPVIVNMPLNNDVIKYEKRKLREKNEDILLPEDYSGSVPNEVIVDNEDSTLFVLSKRPVIGLLPKLLDRVEDTPFKYAGVSLWNAPLQWSANTNERYYGKYIRSAFIVRNIRSKGGNQTATWKIPVPSPGRYELYYYMFLNDNVRYNRRWYKDAEYRFKVSYGNDVEDAYIGISGANDGWTKLGDYDFESDTVSVTLSNESSVHVVVADAVKIVKR
jgi:ABC-type transport system involved in multi-copper enzyme maturation permease subunit